MLRSGARWEFSVSMPEDTKPVICPGLNEVISYLNLEFRSSVFCIEIYKYTAIVVERFIPKPLKITLTLCYEASAEFDHLLFTYLIQFI